ncbi:MAG: hypothetical protein LUC43_04485 [Burkholderiales bacterium]|nr:hypothetical protein [Burkholderiales bacterium]
MDLLTQCNEWLKERNFLAIIKALDTESDIELTPELSLVLARAYNGVACGWPDYWIYRDAIKVLEKWKDWGKDQAEWNVLMGISYYNLDQKMVALQYLQKALEERPDDNEAQYGIDRCLSWMKHPHFELPFERRANFFWQEITKIEPQLCKLAADGVQTEEDVSLLHNIDEIIKQAVGSISIDIGGNDNRNQLALSPGGDWCKFQELVFLQRKMPGNLKERWDCLVGYQPAPHWEIPIGENPNSTVTLKEVTGWLEKQEDGTYALSAYSDKLVDLVKNRKDLAIKTLKWLVNIAIGEIPRMFYFYEVEPLESPKAAPSFPLADLGKIWVEKGYELSLEPNYYFQHPLTYTTPVMKGEPSGIADEKQRWDITDGCTSCKELLDDYLSNSDKHANELIAHGATPGFFFFAPPYARGKDFDKNYDLLNKLQAALLEGPVPQPITITGASFGMVFWYLDFIAWNIDPVLQMAERFFWDNYSRFSGFQLFMQDAKPLIWDGDEIQKEKDAEKTIQ